MKHYLIKGKLRKQVYDTQLQASLADGYAPDQVRIGSLVEAEVDAICEDLARSWGYGTETQSPLSSATMYAASQCSKQAECILLIKWKPAIWDWLENYRSGIKAGTVVAPTSPEQVMSLLLAAVPKPTRG